MKYNAVQSLLKTKLHACKINASSRRSRKLNASNVNQFVVGIVRVSTYVYKINAFAKMHSMGNNYPNWEQGQYNTVKITKSSRFEFKILAGKNSNPCFVEDFVSKCLPVTVVFLSFQPEETMPANWDVMRKTLLLRYEYDFTEWVDEIVTSHAIGSISRCHKTSSVLPGCVYICERNYTNDQPLSGNSNRCRLHK